MDYSAYFENENIDLIRNAMVYSNDQFGRQIHFLSEHKSDIAIYDIALIGVPGQSENTQSGLKDTPDIIRKFLYGLYATEKVSILDLGNIVKTESVNDTYMALRDILADLILKGVKPIIIGGDLHLNYAVYLAMASEKIECNMNIVSPRLNYSKRHEQNNPELFINKILENQDHYLYNYSNIGYQEYCNSSDDLEKINELFYDTLRLGVVRSDLIEAEPLIRDSNIIGFDISSVRYSDAPGFHSANPNGFYGEEICQLAKYAGLSSNNKVFGIYNVNPDYDNNNITSHLAAQIIWYYIKGHYQAEQTLYGWKDMANSVKFNVSIDNGAYTIVFYKNKLTEKWWMEIPQKNTKDSRIISCTCTDYKIACNNELPDRWWRAYQKSN